MFCIRAQHFGEDQAELFMSVRNSSVDFAGEGTDLLDVMSACWAATLRAKEIASVRMHDVLNPAVDIPGETYARILQIAQPTDGVFSTQEVDRRGALLQKEGQAARGCPYVVVNGFRGRGGL